MAAFNLASKMAAKLSFQSFLSSLFVTMTSNQCSFQRNYGVPYELKNYYLMTDVICLRSTN